MSHGEGVSGRTTVQHSVGRLQTLDLLVPQGGFRLLVSDAAAVGAILAVVS